MVAQIVDLYGQALSVAADTVDAKITYGAGTVCKGAMAAAKLY
jgi:hypothetical protein